MANFQLKQTGAEVQQALDNATKVVANPSTTASTSLNKITIGDTTYSVEGGGGTYVEANPDETATDTLTKIEIDETVYNIAGGAANSPMFRITKYGGDYFIYDKDDRTIDFNSFVENVLETLQDGTISYVSYQDYDDNITFDYYFKVDPTYFPLNSGDNTICRLIGNTGNSPIKYLDIY